MKLTFDNYGAPRTWIADLDRGLGPRTWIEADKPATGDRPKRQDHDMSNNSDWDNDGFDGGGSYDAGQDDGAQTSDVYTETTYKSWFSRIWDAIGGIAFGLLLLIGAIVLLFWNEGRAVETANALNEGAKLAVEANAEEIDPALDGKLVHVTAPLIVEGDPRDNDFGVSADGAVRLVRKVEMYQWKEKTSSKSEKKLGGGEETVTTRSYVKQWSSEAVSSGSFKVQQGHQNPAMAVHGKTFPAKSVWLGAYALTSEQASGLGSAAPAPVSEEQVAKIGAALRRPARMIDDKVVVGYDPLQPQIGDLRISYEAAKVEEASFVAAQRGKGLSPYETKSGGEVFLSTAGAIPAKDMFKEAQDDNTILTWVLRLAGFILTAIGFKLIMKIASVLADVVPFFGGLVDTGLDLVAALLGGALTLLVTGIAWIFYRPLLGGLLIGASLVFLVWPMVKARMAQARAAREGGVARGA